MPPLVDMIPPMTAPHPVPTAAASASKAAVRQKQPAAPAFTYAAGVSVMEAPPAVPASSASLTSFVWSAPFNCATRESTKLISVRPTSLPLAKLSWTARFKNATPTCVLIRQLRDDLEILPEFDNGAAVLSTAYLEAEQSTLFISFTYAAYRTSRPAPQQGDLDGGIARCS